MNALGVAVPMPPPTLPESMSRDEMLKYYSDYANMVCREVTDYQRRIRELETALAADGVAVPVPAGPLRELGAYLSRVLDEDQWATAEAMLLRATGVALPDGGQQE